MITQTSINTTLSKFALYLTSKFFCTQHFEFIVNFMMDKGFHFPFYIGGSIYDVNVNLVMVLEGLWFKP
jgi:hypothetical protein